MDQNVQLLGWDLPSLGSCLHGYSFHPPEEENKGLFEEVWLVTKYRLFTLLLEFIVIGNLVFSKNGKL